MGWKLTALGVEVGGLSGISPWGTSSELSVAMVICRRPVSVGVTRGYQLRIIKNTTVGIKDKVRGLS